MRIHNSQIEEFYLPLLVSIHHDMVSAISPRDEIERDTEEIQNRALHEGMHFLTKVLPALGKSIDVSLASGTPLAAMQFKKKFLSALPLFMHSCFSRVFRSDGVPWFATWYTDILYAVGENAYVENVEVGTPASSDNRFARAKFHICYAVKAWLLGISSDECDRFLGKGFPGLDFLREIPGITEEWIQDISAGPVHPDLRDSDVSSSSHREMVAVALRALRQVCYSFYKLKLPYTDEQQAKTLADFVETDEALAYKCEDLNTLARLQLKQARHIICRVLANAEPLSGIPRHGPGAVATGEKSPEKHRFSRLYTRLDRVFKYDQWFFCNLNHVCDSYTELQALEVLEEGTAKVVLVPKDSRGPRLISAEPLEYQWIQQSLMRVLVDTIEHHRLSGGFVNFTDQTVNRDLAKRSSADFRMVTLDMKEASDRVSLGLVRDLFPARWFEALDACRSASTQLPDGRIVRMKKFAPMGSAVCFPVEALIFWALSVSALMTTYNLPLRKAATKVYVYGDDIICDSRYHAVIGRTLERFGLLLNPNKCCTAGPFKESCGMDAYLGHAVTPTRISAVYSRSVEPSMIASYVEYSNAFYRDGHFETALFLEGEVQAILRSRRMAPIPTVSSGNPSCIAFVREHERALPKNRSLGCRIRKSRKGSRNDYHVHEVAGYRLETKSKMTKSWGWPFLLRKLTELEAKKQNSLLGVSAACVLLTGQYPIAHRVRLKRAWTPLV